MKTGRYQKRFYRDWVRENDLYLTRISVKETDLQILTDKPIDEDFIKSRLRIYRRYIEDYISKDRRFLTALKPIEVEMDASPLIKDMAKQAEKANVGPLAAVAGAIAQYLGNDILKNGFKEVIVENGGDIFLKIKKTRHVGIYAGTSGFSGKLSLRIKPKDTPLGICASSGTVGGSLSFGNADAAIVLAENAILADAAATAASNMVKAREDFQKAINFAKNIAGISGVVIIMKDCLASWGKIEFAGAIKSKKA